MNADEKTKEFNRAKKAFKAQLKNKIINKREYECLLSALIKQIFE